MKFSKYMSEKLGSEVRNGSSSSETYAVFAEDEEKGAVVALRPIGLCAIRLRLMPSDETSKELGDWKKAFPNIPWSKKSDTRNSIILKASLQLEEQEGKEMASTPNARISFQSTRMATRLTNELAELLGEGGMEPTVDIQSFCSFLVGHWADNMGYRNEPYDQINKMERQMILQGADPDKLTKALESLKDTFPEGASFAPPECPPYSITSFFFDFEEEVDEDGIEEDQDTNDILLDNVEAEDEADED